MILSSQGIHPREMVDSLVRFHPIQFVSLDNTISPQDIPLIIWVIVLGVVSGSAQSHLEHRLGDVPYNMVLGLGDVQH